MANDRIEALIEKGAWAEALSAVEKQIERSPDDHWLWARLSALRYEQRDYKGARDAAQKARKIVPDCPLALWSYAGATDMLGKTKAAAKIYLKLLRRGVDELKSPDEDADECWEGADWTRSLMVDCVYRVADSLAKLGQKERAGKWYNHFLDLLSFGMQGIYSRQEAIAKLNKLLPSKKAAPDGMAREIKALERVMSQAISRDPQARKKGVS